MARVSLSPLFSATNTYTLTGGVEGVLWPPGRNKKTTHTTEWNGGARQRMWRWRCQSEEEQERGHPTLEFSDRRGATGITMDWRKQKQKKIPDTALVRSRREKCDGGSGGRPQMGQEIPDTELRKDATTDRLEEKCLTVHVVCSGRTEEMCDGRRWGSSEKQMPDIERWGCHHDRFNKTGREMLGGGPIQWRNKVLQDEEFRGTTVQRGTCSSASFMVGPLPLHSSSPKLTQSTPVGVPTCPAFFFSSPCFCCFELRSLQQLKHKSPPQYAARRKTKT